jgi:hypothetical protein
MTNPGSTVLRRATILLALTAVATSCSTRPAPAGTATASPPARSTAPVAATPPASAPAPEGSLSLAARLAREAGARPAGAMRVESAAQALGTGGVVLGPLQQVLARTVGARYCALGRSAIGSALALCEFADDAEAARGIAYSRATFDRMVPGRRFVRVRNLALTLTPAEPGPRFDDEAARATAILAAL